MVREVDRVAVSFGSLWAELQSTKEENDVLREAVGELNLVLEAAVESLGLDQ